MRIALFAATALAAVSVQASAESFEPTILDRFEGRWTAEGAAFGQPARSTMQWSRAVGGRWWRLDYRIDFTSDATPDFEGVAYYKSLAPGRHAATWVDSTGDLHPIDATDDGAALTSLWGVPGQKYGRSEYRFTAEGVEVTDWIQRDGAWREFNRTRFVRSAG
jgi:hypothetical protein